MAKMKKATVQFDPTIYYTGASYVSDRIFLWFPAGGVAGLIAGTIYAGFHLDSLRAELGAILVTTASVSTVTTYVMVHLLMRRIVR